VDRDPSSLQLTTTNHQNSQPQLLKNTVHLWPILLALLVIDGLWAGADRHPSGPQPRTVNYQKRKPHFNNHALVPGPVVGRIHVLGNCGRGRGEEGGVAHNPLAFVANDTNHTCKCAGGRPTHPPQPHLLNISFRPTTCRRAAPSSILL
jgi:hypothetical protein